jgi:glycosyltransferase involved in cell wall biosynthesis
MPAPLVSVIIGTYNAEHHVRNALQCVFDQTFSDYEIVVVDDASRDGTIATLETFGNRIRIVRRTTNSATCELPRYQGVKTACGKYCAFLDADDRWDPQFLETSVAYLEAHPDVPLVHAAVRVIDGADRVLRIRHESAIPSGPRVAKELLRHCFITVSAVVVRRDVWLAAVCEDDIIDFGMDQDFFVAIARIHPIGFIPQTLASYRRSDSSVSVKKWKRIPRNVNTLERLLRNGAWQGITSRREMVDILEEAYHENAEHWRAIASPARACWFCIHGLRRRPLSARLWNALAGAMLACLGLRKF